MLQYFISARLIVEKIGQLLDQGDVACQNSGARFYQLSEERFEMLRSRRESGTLNWVLEIKELKTWQASELGTRSAALWLRGQPGIGKSTIAAYLIEHLRQKNPESLVAYYFFDRGRDMTSIRDAILALAYQCLQYINRTQTSSNDSRNNLVSDESAGVRREVKEKLRRILNYVSKDVFIIIDGIDEAEFRMEDVCERDQSELEVFLQSLIELSTIRMLFLSRPLALVSEMRPRLIARDIVPRDNQADIEAYVQSTICRNKKLQMMFRDEGIHPVQYFQDNANGIFLWVIAVLKELSKPKVRTQLRFRECLDSFSKSCGVMENLYVQILTRMEEDEDTRWIKEILQWLTICGGKMAVIQLQIYVESSLGESFQDYDHIYDDEDDRDLNDFGKFVKRQCGSLLSFDDATLNIFTWVTVQLIHDTLRATLYSGKCPRSLAINESTAHSHAATLSLEVLLHQIDPSLFNTGSRIPCTLWVKSLPKAAKSGEQANQLLIMIHDLFIPRIRVANWLLNLTSMDDVTRNLSFSKVLTEEFPSLDDGLREIAKWLSAWEPTPVDEIVSTAALRVVQGESYCGAIELRQKILDDPEYLGQIVGKVAIMIILYQEHVSMRQVELLFGLALKYYWQRIGCSNKLDELTELTSREFEGLLTWVGGKHPPSQKTLGMMFSVLHRWDESVSCLNLALKESKDDPILWIHLGKSLEGREDYHGAIEAYKAAISHGLSLEEGLSLVVSAYLAANDMEGVLNFADEIDMDRKIDPEMAMNIYLTAGYPDRAIAIFDDVDQLYKLIDAYALGGYKKDGALEQLQGWVKIESTYYAVYEALGKAYEWKGDYNGAVEALKDGIEKQSKPTRLWRQLVDFQSKQQDYEGAVKSLEKGIERFPLSWMLWKLLFDLLIRTGNIPAVMETYEKLNRMPNLKIWSEGLRCFYEGIKAKGMAHEMEGNLSEAIETYETAIRDDRNVGWLWEYLRTRKSVPMEQQAKAAVLRGVVQGLLEINRSNSAARKPIDFRDASGTEQAAMAMISAAWYGLVDVVKLLTMEDGSTLIRDEQGRTPLHITSQLGYAKTVQVLLEANIDISLTDGMGRTALHLACITGHCQVVKLLLEYGADVDSKDLWGLTPLYLAAEHGWREVVHALKKDRGAAAKAGDLLFSDVDNGEK